MVAAAERRVERQEADLVVPAELAVRWRKGKPDLERKGKPDWVKKPRPQTRAAPTLYSTHLECEQTLKLAVQSLRITGYRMARLLEMRDAHYIRWFRGTTRPSSRYFQRIAMILVLHVNGCDFNLVDHLDWDRQEVVYQKGVTIGQERRRGGLRYESFHHFMADAKIW